MMTVDTQKLVLSKLDYIASKKYASDAASNDLFGSAVFVKGNLAFIGAPNTTNGSVYVFKKENDSWSEVDILADVAGASGDLFGTSISFDGEILAVGSPGYSSGKGKVCIFVYSGTEWTQKSDVSGTALSNSDAFGSSVSIQNRYLVIGAPSGDSSASSSSSTIVANSGRAFVYQRGSAENAYAYSLLSVIECPRPTAGDLFGSSVFTDGVRIFVGAPGQSVTNDVLLQGEVYVYLIRPVAITPTIVGSGSGASFLVVANRDGKISESGIAITAGGTGYTTPSIIFPAPKNYPGTTATGTLTISSGAITAITIVNQGLGYTNQEIVFESTLNASSYKGDGYLFGHSICASGNTLVVGSPQELNCGAVYVFTRTLSTWTLQERILNSEDTDDAFGKSVSVCGDLLLVGAPDKGTFGIAYLYERSTNSWTQIAKYQNSPETANCYFGLSVSVSELDVLIGASDDDDEATNAGAAVFFKAHASIQSQILLRFNTRPFMLSLGTDEPTSWVQKARIASPNYSSSSTSPSTQHFAASVDCSGKYAVIGSPLEKLAYVYKNPNQVDASSWEISAILQSPDEDAISHGRIYIYQFVDGAWEFLQKISAPITEPQDLFGWSVSLDHYTLVVGSPGYNSSIGQAYSYLYSEKTKRFAYTQTISSPNDTDYNYGWSVSTQAGNLLVGSPGNTDMSVYDGFGFGKSVAIYGNFLIVGCPRD